ncbi:hypothetical protein GMLC_21610 [Geomonas limicola]|uniref:Uncharacterized protein n=1 Tax=Geomonas limicola TaxID=2740186 RepID=A0A6V8N7P3_9BACT|nr:hypothetical protein [Geomonas limicola]GFO68582.1 hypothetical protein GMLC_21610 [Geomonas limicola]
MKKTAADYQTKFTYVEISIEELKVKAASLQAIMRAAADRATLQDVSVTTGSSLIAME